MPDPLMQVLAELPSAEPDFVRAERIRLRCLARLARQARRASDSRPSAPRQRTAQLWQPLIAVLGAIYLTEVIVEALRFYGLFLD